MTASGGVTSPVPDVPGLPVDDDGPVFQRPRPRRRHRKRLLGVQRDAHRRPGRAGRPFGKAGLVVGDGDLDVIDELEGVRGAGVEGLAEDAPAGESFRGDAESAGRPAREGLFRLVEAEAQVIDADGHVGRGERGRVSAPSQETRGADATPLAGGRPTSCPTSGR